MFCIMHIIYTRTWKKLFFFRSWPELNAFYFRSCIGLFSSSQYRHVKLWNAYRKYTVSLPTVWWITICNCSASANHTSTVQSLIIHGCQNAFIPVWNNTICHIFRLWKALKQHRQSIVVHVSTRWAWHTTNVSDTPCLLHTKSGLTKKKELK